MSVRILTGDCRAMLATLPDASVQCCVTSPPYYGLRDYQVTGQIGLEQSPEAYVAEMVAVFREVRRVLADTGTCWINLGDSYCSTAPGTRNAPQPKGSRVAADQWANIRPATPAGMKPKDLLGIPWMVAFALRADGWWLRSDIIWAKPSCMPESVTDRPTSAHEHVFLLTKRASYYYDAAAVAEPSEMKPQNRFTERADHPKGDAGRQAHTTPPNWTGSESATRNLRNVWMIPTSPTPLAHFATMPPTLASICIRAGSSERGQCPHCRAPWARVTGKGEPDRDWQRRCGGDANGEYHGTSTKGHAGAGVQDASAVKARILAGMAPTLTLRWQSTCACPEHKPVPQTVLDPFGGAGTTGLVADRLGRNAVLIELNPQYADMARARLRGDCPMFAEVA